MRAKDFQAVGTVIAVDDNSIVVTSQVRRDEYIMPKPEVRSFNGAEVFLNFLAGQLRRFLAWQQPGYKFLFSLEVWEINQYKILNSNWAL